LSITTVPHDVDKPVWILQGDFGRATVNFISRPLVAHAHSQYQFLFKLGGSDCHFRIAGEDCMLTAERAICLNPWLEHAKSASDETPSLILSLVIEASWLRTRLHLANGSTANIFPQHAVVVTPDVRHHVDRIAAAITNHLVAQDDGCLSILEDLITALGRDFADPTLTAGMTPSGRPPGSSSSSNAAWECRPSTTSTGCACHKPFGCWAQATNHLPTLPLNSDSKSTAISPGSSPSTWVYRPVNFADTPST
jgi:AraC family transcriptional regulator